MELHLTVRLLIAAIALTLVLTPMLRHWMKVRFSVGTQAKKQHSPKEATIEAASVGGLFHFKPCERSDAIGTSRHSRRCNIPGRYLGYCGQTKASALTS